jgi:hypothetical protein
MRTYAKLLIFLGIIGTAGCATDDNYYIQHGCTVTQEDDGQFITCADQSMFIPSHEYISDIIDPCGNGPGHDEVIIIFSNGSSLAWYKNLGLVQLQEYTPYVTTDAQRCHFEIQGGLVIDYE